MSSTQIQGPNLPSIRSVLLVFFFYNERILIPNTRKCIELFMSVIINQIDILLISCEIYTKNGTKNPYII